MRHPKNPFSPAEPDDGAFDRPHDRHELAADAAPGRGSGNPPPLPRRTGDSGLRPRSGQVPPPQQDFWPLTDPEDSWPLAPRPPAEPAGYWSPGDLEDSWAAPAPAQGGLRDDGGQEAGPEDSRRPERSLPPEDLHPPRDDLSWQDEQRREDEPPRPERVPAAAAGPAPDQDDDPAPASMGFQDLWESWEPPYDPIGAISEPVRHPATPYPELVRDTEYEDDLGLWETLAEGRPAGGPHYPDYPGPRRRARHARNPGRPRLNGAFLALAGALAIAGAIPLGILGARTLAHHGNPALKTAPLSASHAAAS